MAASTIGVTLEEGVYNERGPCFEQESIGRIRAVAADDRIDRTEKPIGHGGETRTVVKKMRWMIAACLFLLLIIWSYFSSGLAFKHFLDRARMGILKTAVTGTATVSVTTKDNDNNDEKDSDGNIDDKDDDDLDDFNSLPDETKVKKTPMPPLETAVTGTATVNVSTNNDEKDNDIEENDGHDDFRSMPNGTKVKQTPMPPLDSCSGNKEKTLVEDFRSVPDEAMFQRPPIPFFSPLANLSFQRTQMPILRPYDNLSFLHSIRAGGPTNMKRCFASFQDKTVYDGVRFIYVAGLEHTGHHLWHNGIMPSLFNMSNVAPFYGNAGSRIVAKTIQYMEYQADGRCDVFVRRENCHNVSDLFVSSAQVCELCKTAFLVSCSYPCWDNRRHPDIGLIARAAENARVDLRIIVAVRDPIETMHELTVARASILDAHCKILTDQLQGIDPKFYMCADYDDYNDSNFLRDLSNFVGVGVEDVTRASYHPKRKKKYQLPASVYEAFEQYRVCSQQLLKIAKCKRTTINKQPPPKGQKKQPVH